MEEYVVETESGSIYKILREGRAWKINVPDFKGWKEIGMLGKGRQSTPVQEIQTIGDFKGAFIWYRLMDRQDTSAKTGRVVKTYAEA